jgi:hypothetical protein
MGTTCKVCGSFIDEEQLLKMKGQKYCSRSCQKGSRYLQVKTKPTKKILRSIPIFAGVLSLIGIIGYFSSNSYDSFFWLIITLPGAALLLILVYPLISLEYKRAVKYQNLVKNRRVFCPFCEAEVEKPDDEGPIVCMSCGKKTPMCHICGKRIMETNEVFTIVPCGHTVHKGEILEWLGKSKECPLCEETIAQLDVDLEDG